MDTIIRFDVIAAVDDKHGISRDGHIPWQGTDAGNEDMRFFRDMTSNTIVIMGRKTWDSLTIRPLPKRVNIIISTTAVPSDVVDQPPEYKCVYWVTSFQAALDVAIRHWNMNKHIEYGAIGYIRGIYVIGGSRVYNEALTHPLLGRVFITYIKGDYGCDNFFPPLNGATNRQLKLIDTMKRKHTKTRMYEPVNEAEHRYIEVLRELMKQPVRPTRSGPTRSLFGVTLEFPLIEHGHHDHDHYNNAGRAIIPIMTHKRVAWRSGLTELLWMLSGRCANTDMLRKHNVKFWDGNTSADYLSKVGLDHYEPDRECGPIYGYQWRSFNATYNGPDDHPIDRNDHIDRNDLIDKGVDQFAQLITSLRNDPYGRRHIMSGWNPAQLDQMILPPCHMTYQFYVHSDGDGSDGSSDSDSSDDGSSSNGTKYLSCIMYQRSGDYLLGVPINISNTAFLTHIVAKLTGMIAYSIKIVIADCHVYEDHINTLENSMIDILDRKLYGFPRFSFSDDIAAKDYSDHHRSVSSIIDELITDMTNAKNMGVVISDYHYGPSIRLMMSP